MGAHVSWRGQGADWHVKGDPGPGLVRVSPNSTYFPRPLLLAPKSQASEWPQPTLSCPITPDCTLQSRLSQLLSKPTLKPQVPAASSPLRAWSSALSLMPFKAQLFCASFQGAGFSWEGQREARSLGWRVGDMGLQRAGPSLPELPGGSSSDTLCFFFLPGGPNPRHSQTRGGSRVQVRLSAGPSLW